MELCCYDDLDFVSEWPLVVWPVHFLQEWSLHHVVQKENMVLGAVAKAIARKVGHCTVQTSQNFPVMVAVAMMPCRRVVHSGQILPAMVAAPMAKRVTEAPPSTVSIEVALLGQKSTETLEMEDAFSRGSRLSTATKRVTIASGLAFALPVQRLCRGGLQFCQDPPPPTHV